jgi:hypothetical protein
VGRWGAKYSLPAVKRGLIDGDELEELEDFEYHQRRIAFINRK